MSAPFSTVQLNPETWDVFLDANGNIAIAAPPYAVAQDVSSAICTFEGEVYYDDTLGVQYGQILGKQPPLNVVLGDMEAAALTVPSVVNAVASIQSYSGQSRAVVGQVQFTDSSGVTQTVTA